MTARLRGALALTARGRGAAVAALVLVLLVAALADIGLLDVVLLGRGLGNLAEFVGALFPPDLSALPTLAEAMAETIEIAFVGTILGFLLALPLSLAASPLLFPPGVTGVVKVFLAVVRTVPSLFWAIVFVVAVGLGPAAGALGVAMYSLGYLGKLLNEIFDGVDPEVVDAVRSVGASRLQLARYALIPEAANGILAQLLFMFDYNVRASSIMGFVGAGGIGFYLLGYLQVLRYDLLLTALLVTLAVVLVIDRGSAAIRRSQLQAVVSRAPAE
jgi:phosphonate transport system permease protein